MNIGRYRILKELGKGGMGIVYLADDPNLDIKVALKVLREDWLSNEPFREKFLAEARALGRLDHPNIVRVFNVDRDDNTIFIAMEYIDGESLETLAAKRRMTVAEIAEFGAAAADALDHAHQKGIVHRDIKPGNILFRSDGRLKITDFGIAHIEDPAVARQTVTRLIMGTPPYMSPEQVMCRHVDGRSDLFSLGVVLYELAAGSLPFAGASTEFLFDAITTREPAELLTKRHDLPKPLAGTIMRCLRKEPDKRFATGKELAAALRGVPIQAPWLRKIALALALQSAISIVLVVYFFGHQHRTSVTKTAPAVPPSPAALAGVLEVTTAPPGAFVYVDGALKGRAPGRFKVPAGKHEVRLTLPRHYEWEAEVSLEARAAVPLTVKLMPSNEQ